MVRKKSVLILELFILLLIGIVLLIVSTGGFSFAVGSHIVTAYRLKNPLLGIFLAFCLRKLLIGKSAQSSISMAFFRQRFTASQRFRRLVLVCPFCLLMIMGVIATLNPIQHGMKASYYQNVGWSGSPLKITTEYAFNLGRMQSEYPDINNNYSIQWYGFIFISTAGEYEFTTISDDGSELYLDHRFIVDNRGMHTIQKRTGQLFLEQGFYPLDLRYMQVNDTTSFEVLWKPPGQKRKELTADRLYLKIPTQTEFFIGRCLDTIVIVCKVLLLSNLLLGCCLYRLLVPVFSASWIGRTYRKCRARLFKTHVPEHVFPTPTKLYVSSLLLAMLGYILLSLMWNYPVLKYFSTKMFGQGGDRYIYLWNMWWMKKALLDLHTNPLFTDYLFFPQGISLAFHDFSLLLTAISLPLQGVFTLTEIYNLLYLLTYILGGSGCFLLVRYLTGEDLAAFLAGVVFVFWGGRTYYVDHFYLASIQWIPFCALYLIKTLRERSYRNPILAAVFLALNALTSWVYAIYMVLFVVLWLLYSAWTEREALFTMACLKRLGLVGVLFMVMILPVAYPMIAQILAGQKYMNAPVMSTLSASPNMLFLPNPSHGILGKYVTYWYLRAGLPIPEWLTGGLFLGYTVLLLCLYTVRKLKHLKPGFWMLSAIVFLLLSLGPHLRLFSKEYSWIPLPYLLLDYIPLLKTVRVPERFVIMGVFCCSVLVGYAGWDIFRRIRFRKTVFVLLMGVILFEFFRFPLLNPLEKTPEFYTMLGRDPEPYAILELTRLTELPHAARRSSLFQITHGKKLFNGFVARVPQESYNQAYRLYRVFDDFLTQPREYLTQSVPSVLKVDPQTLCAILTYYNVRYVTLYHDYWYGSFSENLSRMKTLFGEPVAQAPGMYLFQVKPTPVGKSLVFPGHRMYPAKVQTNDIPIRQASQDGDIRIINVNQYRQVRLQFEGKSTMLPQKVRVQIFVNDQMITTVQIGDWVEVLTPPVAIHPGENTIRLHLPDIVDWYSGIYLRQIKVELL